MEKKYKLETEARPDFIIYSINSTLKDYKLVFNLNKVQGIKLKRIRDYKKAAKNKPENYVLFPVFHFSDHDRNYTVISAKSDENRLFPSLKQTDYLLLINGNHHPGSLQSFIAEIRKLPNIILVFEIKPANIQIESFLNDMELHLLEGNQDE